MSAYYNEFDPKAAATLRELIREGLIAPGDVDERSIEDVLPSEIAGYTQVHLFAGFGIWSLAFRMAGWPDSRPVWSASCPCQPFSAAGKGGGFADDRHLWPAAFWLLQHGKRPEVSIYGEQVASPDGLTWLDLVRADLETVKHSCRSTVLASAGFGAPIIRQRTYWIASASSNRRWRERSSRPIEEGWESQPEFARQLSDGLEGCCIDGGLDESPRERGEAGLSRSQPRQEGFSGILDNSGNQLVLMGCALEQSCERDTGEFYKAQTGVCSSRLSDGNIDQRFEYASSSVAAPGLPGPTNGFWRNADWLRCRDDKWRPVEPGTFPLAYGYPERVGILRGAGNAISPQVAASFIWSTM